MGQLGALITAYMDGQRYRPSNADIAKDVGVTRGTVGNWIAGTSRPPEPYHLYRLARLIGHPYGRVLDAALHDAGYLPEEVAGNAEHPTPNTPAGGAPADKFVRAGRVKRARTEPRSATS